MRLGPFKPEGYKHAPIFTQLHLTLFLNDDTLAAATLAACSAAFLLFYKTQHLLPCICIVA
jgi:hypothetical protein